VTRMVRRACAPLVFALIGALVSTPTAPYHTTSILASTLDPLRDAVDE